jgi:hypothetical protein
MVAAELRSGINAVIQAALAALVTLGDGLQNGNEPKSRCRGDRSPRIPVHTAHSTLGSDEARRSFCWHLD